jgi:hypothetical protein
MVYRAVLWTLDSRLSTLDSRLPEIPETAVMEGAFGKPLFAVHGVSGTWRSGESGQSGSPCFDLRRYVVWPLMRWINT